MNAPWFLPWRSQGWQTKSDLLAGLMVAILIIPQSIAYGMLAGLPASTALACCVFPLIAYGLFGSSRALAVGPVAIVSLMVGEALIQLPSSQAVAAAQLLSLQVGLILLSLRILNLGRLVNFIGHPVVHGFSSAAAILIIFKQIPLLIGSNVLKPDAIQLNILYFSLVAISVLLLIRQIKQFTLNKIGPLLVISLGIGLTFIWPESSLPLVPQITSSSPISFNLNLPWNLFYELLPSASLIALIGFLESTSVAKTLARQQQESIKPNQELLGLSAANVMAGIFQGFPVAGGFGRSMVNHQAGATSPLAGIFTALFVLVFLVFATPLIGLIPMAGLGAIVVIAVWPLIDLGPLYKNWQINVKGNSIWLLTFAVVLLKGAEIGIAAGVVLSLIFLIRSASTPHIAIIGRIPNSTHFRNVKRYEVETFDNLLAIRIDEGLHFANQELVNEYLEQAILEHPHAQHLLLVCSAINVLDADGLDLLQHLKQKLAVNNKVLHLAEVKGPIMDQLQQTHFLEELAPGKVFLSTHDAFIELGR